ncbi:MAG TPA: hypothetical protein VMJ70_15665, partial [Candidatus Sulfotelmatobacter sp.]|nr:hypothetical protein [Candidatus Sulfotelmatobacter sp.]
DADDIIIRRDPAGGTAEHRIVVREPGDLFIGAVPVRRVSVRGLNARHHSPSSDAPKAPKQRACACRWIERGDSLAALQQLRAIPRLLDGGIAKW